jgi:hypothetical protein
MRGKNKKYEWEIGQPLPLLGEHSQTKHHIISDYLKRYVEVVMAHYSMEKLSMTIVDGFAGGGKYIDGLSKTPVDGSPFLTNIQLDEYISWKRLAEFKEAGNWHAAIQEQLANAIFMASGAKHITLFFMRPKKGRAYWLVHLSNVYRARDVMMDIHWKHANNQPYFTHHLGAGIYGLGYRAFKIPGQSSLELCDKKILNEETEKRCVEALSEELPRHIFETNEAISFFQLTDQLGSFTVASESHIKNALQFAIETKEVTQQVTEQVGTKLGLSRDQALVLTKCTEASSIAELMALVGRSNRTKFREVILNPLLEAGLVEMTQPNSPRSPTQRYRLTGKGRAWL